MNEIDIKKKILEVIDKIKPYILNDGGLLEFIKYEDGIVYVSLGGACEDCELVDYTLKEGIELAIISEIPEVIQVVNIANTL